MNFPELVIFLLVTGCLGAIVGGGIGFFWGNAAGAAKLGALLGPIAVGTIITVIIGCCNLREKLKDRK